MTAKEKFQIGDRVRLSRESRSPRLFSGRDLLLQLLDLMIKRGRAPDILSREWDVKDKSFIRFEWNTGHIRDFVYTTARYDAVWKRFNSYWAVN